MNSDGPSNQNDSSNVIFYLVTKSFRSIQTQTSKSEDKNRASIRVFEHFQILREELNIFTVKESIIEEIQNHPSDSSSEDATANRYKYCKEVVKPYLKNNLPFCSEFDDRLVRDVLDSTQDDFPDYQPDFPYEFYNGDINGFKNGHTIDKGTNTPGSESDSHRSIEDKNWFLRDSLLKRSNSFPKNTYDTKGKEATCHKAGVRSPSKSDSSSQTDDFEFPEEPHSFYNMSPSPPPPTPPVCESDLDPEPDPEPIVDSDGCPDQEVIIRVKCKNHKEGVKLRCTRSTEVTPNGKCEIKFKCKEEKVDTDLKCRKGSDDSLECKDKSSDVKLKCREEYPDGCGKNADVKLKCREKDEDCNQIKPLLKYKCKEQPPDDSECPTDDDVNFKCQEDIPECPQKPVTEKSCLPQMPCCPKIRSKTLVEQVSEKICTSLDSIFKSKGSKDSEKDENSKKKEDKPCGKKSQDSYKCIKIAEMDPEPVVIKCLEKAKDSHKCTKIDIATEHRLVCKEWVKVGEPAKDITLSEIPKPKDTKPLITPCPHEDITLEYLKKNMINAHYKTIDTLKNAADDIINNFSQKSSELCKDNEAINKVKKSCEDFIKEVSKRTKDVSQKKEEPSPLETAKHAAEIVYYQACTTTQQVNEIFKCESKQLLGFEETVKPARPKPLNSESVSKKSSIFSGFSFYGGKNNSDDDDDKPQLAIIGFEEPAKPPTPKPHNTETVSKKSSTFSGLSFYGGKNNDDDDKPQSAIIGFVSNVIENVTSVVSGVGTSVNEYFRQDSSSSFDRPTPPNLSNTTLTADDSSTKTSQASKGISKVFSTIYDKIYAIFSDATDVGQNVSSSTSRSKNSIPDKVFKTDNAEDDDD